RDDPPAVGLHPHSLRRHLMTLSRRLCIFVVLLSLVACEGSPSGPATSTDASLDTQLRQQFRNWGVVEILPVATQDPAMVDLGRSLFFDKILSGNRDVACASCHSPMLASGDGQSLAAGTGATIVGSVRHPGLGRDPTPRNAPSLFNSALGSP